MKKQKAKKPIPFHFILENLAAIKPETRPMFGCTAVYSGSKILMILREKEGGDVDNGIWLATVPEHHESLQKTFKKMRGITIFGEKGSWQLLPSDALDFEEAANLMCELILKRDPRIGKIPNAKKPKESQSKNY